MSAKILDYLSQDLDSNIMPWHPNFLIPINKRLLIRLNIGEALDPLVVVIDAGEELGFVGVR